MKGRWVGSVSLLLACGAPQAFAPPEQVGEDVIRASTAALEHTLTRLRESGEISATSRLVLAPEPIPDTQGTLAADSQLVEAVARSVGIVVAPLRQVLICPDTCRLEADQVFQFGGREIRGDTAYVWVYARWYNPSYRDPTPMAGHEWILQRSGNRWTVIGSRGIMRS